jgi:hypothetical protein
MKHQVVEMYVSTCGGLAADQQLAQMSLFAMFSTIFNSQIVHIFLVVLCNIYLLFWTFFSGLLFGEADVGQAASLQPYWTVPYHVPGILCMLNGMGPSRLVGESH